MVRVFIGCSLVGLALGCGGVINPSEDSGLGGAGSGGTNSASGGSASGGQSASGGASTGGNTYVDPPCPDLPLPPDLMFCDPLGVDPDLGCPQDYGCYATLNYPTDPCAHAQFVAECRYLESTSVGEQGDVCGSAMDCRPGFMCVVGAGGGPRCGTLCPLDAADICPDGLICGETDVPGYGVCY